MAATSFMKTWQDFDLIQLVVLPLFLFSATFYPIETYPPALQIVVQLTPLYQGVDLIRSLRSGRSRRSCSSTSSTCSLMGIAGLLVVVAPARQAAAQVDATARSAARGPRPPRSSRAGAVHASSNGASSVAREKVARFRDETVLGPSGTGLRRPGRPGSCWWASRRRRTAAIGPGGCSRAMRRATSCGRRSIALGWRIVPSSRRVDDGLSLTDVYIAAAVRCAPPANKPTPEERDNCAPYLARELGLLDRVRVLLALGAYGWDAALRAIAANGGVVPVKPRFGHGTEVEIGRYRLIGSYHPSQQNTFTGKLTPSMFDDAISAAVRAAALR